MKSTELRQLIRESINDYIREIDEAGNVAALEAKMGKTQEAIELREKKMNMDGLDEAYHDMLDKGKMKELASEVKALKKSLTKYEKQLEKLKNKGAKAEETEEKEIVDEVAIDEMTNDPAAGPQLEEINESYEDVIKSNNYDYDTAYAWLEDQGLDTMKINAILNNIEFEDGGLDEEMDIYEMLYMQKIAGIISETEYKAKVEEARFKKGTDIGKKGKGFAKIAKSAAKEYGSKEAGKRVAGAILKKVIKKEK